MRGIILGILAAFALVGAAAAQQGNPVKGDPAQGEVVARKWCASCHLVNGQAKALDTAPAFASIAKDPTKGPDFLRSFLSTPHPRMPPLQLSRQHIEDVIAYIGTLAKR